MVRHLRHKSLTKSFVERTNTPGIYGDSRGGRGLKLIIEPRKNRGVSKRFIQSLTIIGHGKADTDLNTTRAIGPYPEVSLKRARKIARKWAKSARKGIDPKEAPTKKPLPKLRDAATVVLAKEAKSTTIDTTNKKQSYLARYIYPTLGNKRLSGITPLELYNALNAINETAPSKTMAVAKLVSRIFQHYAALNKKFSNTITPELLAQLPPRTTPVEPYPSLSYHILPSAFQKLNSQGRPSTYGAVKATILTGLRATSAAGGEWNEITWKQIDNDFDWAPEVGWEPVDWDEAAAGSTKTMVWTIPAWRMKGKKIAKKAHRVPVSTALLKIFLEMRQHIGKVKGDPRFIFPGTLTTRHVNIASMIKFMKKHNLPSDIIDRHAVVHGFRSTFRNWCAEHDVPFDLAELALAHTLPPVVRAYLRSDLLAQRTRLMEYYGQYAEGQLAPGWTWVEGDPKMIALHAALDQLRADTDRQIAAANERADHQIAAANERADRAEERSDKRIAELSAQIADLGVTA